MEQNFNQDLIDRYLLGTLDENELIDFRKKMNKESTLKEEVEMQEAIIGGIQALGNQQLKDKLKGIHKEVIISDNNAKGIYRTMLRNISIAASFLIILLGGWWFSAGKTAMTGAELYAHNFEPYTIAFGTRSNDAEKELITATTYYKNKEYAQFIEIIEPRAKQAPDNDEFNLALGIANMELGAIEKALSYFNNIKEASILNNQKQWYMALLYLKQGDKTTAKTYLKELANNELADKYEEAKALLEELD